VGLRTNGHHWLDDRHDGVHLMPLATKNNAIIVKDGKLAENCGCCCGCLGPFCCNASDEMFATLSLDGSLRTWEYKVGNPDNPLYTINMELEFDSINRVYTLDNVSQSLPCGTAYENELHPSVSRNPQDWPTVPQIRLFTAVRQPQSIDTVAVNIQSLQASGRASYRATGNIGGPREILDSPVILGFGSVVPAPVSAGSERPCQRWNSLGEISLAGDVAGLDNDYFNFYQSFIRRGLLHDWSTPLTATVALDV